MHDSNLAMDFGAQAKILEAIKDERAPTDEWISTRGLKFRLKKVSPFIAMEISRKTADPKVPTYYDKESERERENPLDPNYLEELNVVRTTRGVLAMNANLALGTELIYCPPEIQGVGSHAWSDELDEATAHVVEVPDSGIGRYLAWLRYYALVEQEVSDLMMAVLRYSGVVLEADVETAAENFSGDETRSATNETNDQANIESRDSI
jgi:hypothetical protein